jgi:hypothetical protein
MGRYWSKPRPIHLKHGLANIDWNRTTTWVKKNLVNRFETIANGDGWCEERTGLHEREFIETRRHWFTKTVSHNTKNTVNVLNLVDGEEVIVESLEGLFEAVPIHYAETFIVPASVGAYTIRPIGNTNGHTYATMKAFVRHEDSKARPLTSLNRHIEFHPNKEKTNHLNRNVLVGKM